MRKSIIAALLACVAMTLAAAPVTTVSQDSSSATGYSVRFCFTDPDYGTENEAERVRIYGEWGFSDPACSTVWTGEFASPWDWQDGYTLWFGNHTAPYYDMENEGEGLWTITVPLPAGTYKYRFYVGGDAEADVNDVTGCYMAYDPAKAPSLPNVVKDPYQLSAHTYFTSYIYVPWDSVKQAGTGHLDELQPRTDGRTGTVLYEETEIAEGDFAGRSTWYGIYLPYGYDKESEDGYRILIMVHGGGEAEPAWFNSGLVEILDNLIAEGRMEPTVVVTPSLNDFDRMEPGTSMKHDYDRTALDDFLRDQLLPYMEESYNVSSKADWHAIGGCSNGGIQAWVAYFNSNECYRYYIPLSGAEPSAVFSDVDYMRPELRDDVVMIGLSLYDNAGWSLDYPVIYGGYNAPYNMAKANLPFYISNGIPYGHGYAGWRVELVEFFSKYLWKVQAPETVAPEVLPVPALTFSDRLTGEELYQAALLYRAEGKFDTAIKFMHEALARGCDNALVEMAAWYFAGKAPEVPGKDSNEVALSLMEIASSRDNPMAAYYWGLIYAGKTIPGLGGLVVGEDVVPRDGEKAVYYYELSNELGYGKAYRYLGDIFYYGQNGTEIDYARAAEYYRQGAETGDFTTSHLYADCLYNGIGVEKDPETAIALYQYLVDVKAHNKSDYAWGAYMLGKVYEEGIYVDKDLEYSQSCYELAASLGSKEAEAVLASR